MHSSSKTAKIPRISFHLDSSSYSKNNEGCHLYLRVRLEGRYMYLPTNLYVAPEHWDNKSKQVRHVRGHRNSALKEEQMLRLQSNLRMVIGDLIRNGRPLTERSIKTLLGLQAQKTFVGFARHVLANRKKHVSQALKNNYRLCIGKVAQFDPGIQVKQISSEWVESFAEWLRSEGASNGSPLANNTVVLILGILQSLLRVAKKAGILQHDPVEEMNDRPRMRKTRREFLSEREIYQLHSMYVSGAFLRKGSYQRVFPQVRKPQAYHNLVQAFLVSVYTGLRLSDVRRVNDFVRGEYIYLSMKKTDDPIRIKIIDRLREIMCSPDQILNADLPPGSLIHRQLPIVLKVAGIYRPVTYHAARHTFATTLLAKGVDLKTVSQLLGHKRIETTDLYTHITDKQREEGISKMDSIGSGFQESPEVRLKTLLAQHPELLENPGLRKLILGEGGSVIHRVS